MFSSDLREDAESGIRDTNTVHKRRKHGDRKKHARAAWIATIPAPTDSATRNERGGASSQPAEDQGNL